MIARNLNNAEEKGKAGKASSYTKLGQTCGRMDQSRREQLTDRMQDESAGQVVNCTRREFSVAGDLTSAHTQGGNEAGTLTSSSGNERGTHNQRLC